MNHHNTTVIKNSCLKVPVDPINRLPLASYERNAQNSLEMKRMTPSEQDNGHISLGDFYKSIPDYNDVNHLSNQEFYMKLENLRENKQKLLLKSSKHDNVTDWGIRQHKGLKYTEDSPTPSSNKSYSFSKKNKERKTNKTDKYDLIIEKYINSKPITESMVSDIDSVLSVENSGPDKTKQLELQLEKERKKHNISPKRDLLSVSNHKLNGKSISPSYSVSWNNDLNNPAMMNNSNKNSIKNNETHTTPHDDNIYRKSYSVPSSPVKKSYSPQAGLTVTEPFKFYDRYSDLKNLSRLRGYSKELQYLYNLNKPPKHFKANPVPIESRIPLYEKILQDQELRRSISKLQSKAELEAQMKPFSFTEREEKYGLLKERLGCSRIYRSNPQLSMPFSPSESDVFSYKQFRAKPVPKNLFSNYIYEKMKEDDFYRTLNRRIRAEEMLKAASLPPSMAKREKREKRCSNPKCNKIHNNETNFDDFNNGNKHKRSSKIRKKIYKQILDEMKQEGELENDSEVIGNNFISRRTNRRELEEELKRIYGSNSNDTVTPSSGYATRPISAVDMSAINKSNLAAILRIETTKKKLEADVVKQLEEDRYQSEMKWRDSVLRRKPAWKSIQYSHADDLAMRLQMRKDEERLKREQFLHEMEMMYGRVHDQPLMFERCYSPRKGLKNKSESSKLRSNMSKRYLSADTISPNPSRKVSINETAETIGNDFDDYTYKNSDNNSTTKSDDEISECIPEQYRA